MEPASEVQFLQPGFTGKALNSAYFPQFCGSMLWRRDWVAESEGFYYRDYSQVTVKPTLAG